MKKLNNIVTVFAAVATLLACTGCQASETSIMHDSVNIAFVLGITDGETCFNPAIPEFDLLASAPGSDYAFINAEGNTSNIGEAGSIPDLSDRQYTKRMLERINEGVKSDLSSQIDEYQPNSSEMDMASATIRAVRQINAHSRKDKENILVFYTSGRSTQGLIDMVQTPLYRLDVDSSVQSIAQEMNIDMSNIRVVWYCSGDVANNAGQPAFSQSEVAVLEDFYTKLFTALGATDITFKDDLALGDGYSFPDQPVSKIEVEDVTSGLQEVTILDSDTFDTADDQLLDKPLVIPEGKVTFLPDSSEFVDSDLAYQTIQPIAQFLNDNPDLNILVYGTCAGDVDTEFSIRLSKERAEAVKKVLVSHGISQERITAVGVKASDDPYYQFGLTGDDESVNRKCVIVDKESDLAKQILSTQ